MEVELHEPSEEQKTQNETETTSTESTDEVETIKEQIRGIQKSLNPVQKSAAKKALEEAGLPLVFKTVTDIAVLKKCLEVLSNIKK